MLQAPIPVYDDERLAALSRLRLLGTPREADLDRITRLAKHIFKTEIALISLVDKDRQWFKANFGLDATSSPRDVSFCGHAIMRDELFVVPNALADERFADNPFVTDGPNIRFYAGAPLKSLEGQRVGTLCIISPREQELSAAGRTMLEDLGRLVEIVFAHRELSETQQQLIDSLQIAERERLLDPLSGLWNRRGFNELFAREIARCGDLDKNLGIAVVDIDHFKQVNDRFGHATGDRAIRLTAELLQASVKAADIVSRIGGEEFAILMPGSSDSGLPLVGKRIMEHFRDNARIPTSEGEHAFTVSGGLVNVTPDQLHRVEGDQLLAAADTALYAAKHAGRARYVIATMTEEEEV